MAHEISEARFMTFLSRAQDHARWPNEIQALNVIGATNDEMLALVEMAACELRRRQAARRAAIGPVVIETVAAPTQEGQGNG